MGIKINQTMGKMVLEISDANNLPLVTVESILYRYLVRLSEKLEKERSVVIPGITSVKVIYDTETNEYFVRGRVSPALRKRLLQLDESGETSATLSTSLVRDISDKLILPIITVDIVLRGFIEGLLRQAEETGLIDIPNVSAIKVTRSEDGDLSTRGRVSPALQSKLRLLDAG